MSYGVRLDHYADDGEDNAGYLDSKHFCRCSDIGTALGISLRSMAGGSKSFYLNALAVAVTNWEAANETPKVPEEYEFISAAKEVLDLYRRRKKDSQHKDQLCPQ